jgi:hypothetical protein
MMTDVDTAIEEFRRRDAARVLAFRWMLRAVIAMDVVIVVLLVRAVLRHG